MRGRLSLFLAATILLTAAGPAMAQWLWTPQTGRFIDIDRLPKETPELQVQYARELMLEGRYRKALRETAKFDDFYGDSDFADENQFLRGEIEMAQGDYLQAAREFQQVVANYPDSELYDDVIDKQYEIADLYYERGVARQDDRWWPFFRNRPFKRAIEVYTMVIDNQPFTEEAAQARYKIGLCHFTREEYIEAALEYRRVIEEYPDSEWVDEASYDLAMTYYNSSLPPAYDQAPSQLTIDAVQDFAVRFPEDSRMDELKTISSEMRERIATQRLQTAEFYEKRRQFEAALLSYEVVVSQYPGTEAAATAQAWLDANAGPIRDKSHLYEQ